VRAEAIDEGPVEPRRSSMARVVLVCLVAAASFLTEGIAADWSAVYLRESAGADAGTAGIGVVAFSAGMAISRFAGDRVRADPALVVRVGTATAALVLGVALAVGETVPFIAALAILGLSLGPVVPLTFRSAGAIGLGPSRSALAVTVTAGYLGSIVGPLLVGLIADRTSLGAGFLVPVVACVAAAASASALGRRRS
jgi:fucose permease